MHPMHKIKIPLEVIFKLIHATLEIPLIKYNPAKKQENVYRLFADKVSKDGRKIPYLPKARIFELMRNVGKTTSVSVYISYNDADADVDGEVDAEQDTEQNKDENDGTRKIKLPRKIKVPTKK